MIRAAGLTKRYGGTTAVDDVSFTAGPGVVTGFLGPNGAGKSTTLRMLLGLEEPDAGVALVGGRPYRALGAPLREVGALLDAGDVHGGRRARDHLRVLARSNGIPARRVGEVLAEVGLAEVADRRIAGFSLGMRQRLGIAAALLGDPGVLVFDEPINGLDPEGVRWIRGLLRGMAAEGRAVLVSSHVLEEVARTADRVVVIGRGRLLADAPTAEVLARFDRGVLVRAADQPALAAVLRAHGAEVRAEDGGLSVRGVDPGRIGELALAHGIALRELAPRTASLEDAFVALTGGSVEFRRAA
ncbi:ABC transporter ATP-binding protein [Saccharopolyspora hordei]|uniref:ABC-2 type transport system ATP-binding protein n=1 Tax=Saccharopolyspora hordei TaxID=1838 RepID=A0A853AFE7_9PSEU|nr:ATP-binding cassette domain-containing protein [Saccharopolyspora hordei]NYI82546.1 ABC-2 type transport system ATP-binding protein [Saccharopolyspora hordei]